MNKSYDLELQAFKNVIDKWTNEMRIQQKIDSDSRKASEAMRRISTKYKHVNSRSEHILNSVYTYSSVGALVK